MSTDEADGPADDEALFRALSERLRVDVVAATPGWVVRSVERIHDAWAGSTPAAVRVEAEQAGAAAAAALDRRLGDLLGRDIDGQRTNPLSLIRGAARWPTEVLSRAGVPPVVRDDFERERFPDDVYGLAPAGFADLGPGLTGVGMAWGAAKAKVHLARHRPARHGPARHRPRAAP